MRRSAPNVEKTVFPGFSKNHGLFFARVACGPSLKKEVSENTWDGQPINRNMKISLFGVQKPPNSTLFCILSFFSPNLAFCHRTARLLCAYAASLGEKNKVEICNSWLQKKKKGTTHLPSNPNRWVSRLSHASASTNNHFRHLFENFAQASNK